MLKHNAATLPVVQQSLMETITYLKQLGLDDTLLPRLEALMSQLLSMAHHDQLTGALNRESLIEHIDAELKRAQRTRQGFCVAVIGIDQLPEIMAQHGSQEVKRILQWVAKDAIQVLRALDSFGRIGAAEFAIVMPCTWPIQGKSAIMRLKNQLQQLDSCTAQAVSELSFSTGLTCNLVGENADALLARAILALEQARQSGLDQIVELEA